MFYSGAPERIAQRLEIHTWRRAIVVPGTYALPSNTKISTVELRRDAATCRATATAPQYSQPLPKAPRQNRSQIASTTAVAVNVAPALAPTMAPAAAPANYLIKIHAWIAGAMAIGPKAKRIHLLHAFPRSVPRQNGAGRRTVTACRPLSRHAVAWPTRG